MFWVIWSIPEDIPAAAAKSLQSCPTLCNPIDGSLPGSSIPRILQARVLEWVAISFSSAWKWKVKVKSLSRVRLSDPMDCSLPGSSAHAIFQARVLEWVAIAFSGSQTKRKQTGVMEEPLAHSPWRGTLHTRGQCQWAHPFLWPQSPPFSSHLEADPRTVV